MVESAAGGTCGPIALEGIVLGSAAVAGVGRGSATRVDDPRAGSVDGPLPGIAGAELPQFHGVQGAVQVDSGSGAVLPGGEAAAAGQRG